MVDPEETRRDRLVRGVAIAGVPLVLVVVLTISFVADLTPGLRLLVVSAGGVFSALALIAPWLMTRRG